MGLLSCKKILFLPMRGFFGCFSLRKLHAVILARVWLHAIVLARRFSYMRLPRRGFFRCLRFPRRTAELASPTKVSAQGGRWGARKSRSQWSLRCSPEQRNYNGAPERTPASRFAQRSTPSAQAPSGETCHWHVSTSRFESSQQEITQPKLAPLRGLEPPTHGLGNRRSIR